ncbi:iron ABC transporter ATP-binding protein [Aeromicrobium sp. PE09-221]|uniref:ABC transporter ATP-binding protein n=1 Tax=Aeromicrobium sp. PE09-221 TaxID=1898043 RepID=UPI000B3E43CD|nr:ABC transporter ATP-binding protein [Aeromicrobium sp. PE09-221]OUZ08308.1 iron ABC transporter ATP-binding protein [Aeromicrobium sp. PE09-221]
MSAVFELDDVTVIRSGRKLLDSVSWTVQAGEHWVVIGPNGAGKTTLLQILGASLHPTAGRVRILDETLGQVDVFELRTRIGHTSTVVSDRIPAREAVRNVVLSAAYAVVGRWNEEYDEHDFGRVDQLLAELGIAPLADRSFGTLSEGEKKRVLIARALMTDPEAVLLDEPGAGLDLGAREDLLASLDVLSSDPAGAAFVLVTHHVEEIPQGFTHALILAEGKVIGRGPLREVLTSDVLSRAFGQRLELREDRGRFTARRQPAARRAAS